MYVPPRNDLEYSQQRLDAILGRRRLTFNPYTVSDEQLMEIAATTGWGNEFDITQIVIVRFTRLHETENRRKFDGVYMQVASQSDEVFIPLGALKWGVTANDTLRTERSFVGKRPIRNENDVEGLVGKQFFVSRIIRGYNQFGSYKSAYRFHRLKGIFQKDAKLIREAMCAAKIEMLERILAYPHSPDFLSCRKGFFDYETRIRRAIRIISRFSEITPPTHS